MNIAKLIKQRHEDSVKRRDEAIRKYYEAGLSMNKIVTLLKHSKHTIFRAVHAKVDKGKNKIKDEIKSRR